MKVKKFEYKVKNICFLCVFEILRIVLDMVVNFVLNGLKFFLFMMDIFFLILEEWIKLFEKI